eukprot:CAMPEP_0174253518 /NCGR_PEP_ID=MMETSP0439-20130205/2873_1 /TAXON_ID=0 /ORGANISM="Stereomyxa ramosa, Strain Chinc5" /LENGTH=586 /DNA_ID=CAMNT_0015334575 /DNA_START=302 /DNA_END=2062 /DNA_ORIENTATION=-
MKGKGIRDSKPKAKEPSPENCKKVPKKGLDSKNSQKKKRKKDSPAEKNTELGSNGTQKRKKSKSLGSTPAARRRHANYSDKTPKKEPPKKTKKESESKRTRTDSKELKTTPREDNNTSKDSTSTKTSSREFRKNKDDKVRSNSIKDKPKKKRKEGRNQMHRSISLTTKDWQDFESRKAKGKNGKKKKKKKYKSEGSKSDSQLDIRKLPLLVVQKKTQEFAKMQQKEEKRKKKLDNKAIFHPALEYYNIEKNRYNNALPNKATRVKLSGASTEDYINANYIGGETGEIMYIASQAPLRKTFADFWRMVWETNAYVVVMLTKLTERYKVKAEEYWPNAGPLTRTRVLHIDPNRRGLAYRLDDGDSEAENGKPLSVFDSGSSHGSEPGKQEEKKEKNKGKIKEQEEQEEPELTRRNCVFSNFNFGGGRDEDDETGFTEYGAIKVRLQKTDQPSDILTIREFSVKHQKYPGETRSVVQIHFTGWPDFGAPKDTASFYEVLQTMDEYKHNSPKGQDGPIILHCSAGLGRTGTLIAAHIALEQLELYGANHPINLKEIVQKLRQQRNGMVQTTEQYIFLHQLVNEYVQKAKM